MRNFSKPVFLFCLFLFFADSAKAQLLNVERVRGEADTTGWHGDMGFDFSLSSYKDRVLKLANSTNTSYYSQKHSYLFLSSLELVDVDGSSLISSGYFHLRSKLFRKNNLPPELFLQYQYNNNMGLSNRALAGGGVRYNFLSGENLTGHIATGLMYEFEEWKLSGEEAVENDYLKSTSNISVIGRINPQTSLLLTGYYQARPGKFFRPRAIMESQLNVRMSRYLSLSVSFTMQHDAEPIIDVPKLTYELKNGILINF